MSKEIKKAGEVISVLFNNLSSQQFEDSSRLFKTWKDAVGDRIAAHSRVLDVHNGSVIVEVDHPGWNQMIGYRKQAVLTQLQHQFPELGIKTMSIRVKTAENIEYRRVETQVGAGLPRQTAAEEPESDIPLDNALPDELKQVLSRLKDSIRKGKSDH